MHPKQPIDLNRHLKPYSIQNITSSDWSMPWIGLLLKKPSPHGIPPKAVRPSPLMGCLIPKRLHRLSDETLMERWIENPTMPYLTGSDFMKHEPPCDPSDGSPIRKRMSQEGIEKILAYSVPRHQKEIKK
ncbi:MAG: transposase [Flavobacteriaceae bacterium]|nr:transposase [Flavobacteriaceae bacterium]